MGRPQAPTHDTEFAPRPVGDVAAPVFFKLLLGWLPWAWFALEGFTIFLFSANLTIHIVFQVHQPTSSPAPSRGVTSDFTIRAYRFGAHMFYGLAPCRVKPDRVTLAV